MDTLLFLLSMVILCGIPYFLNDVLPKIMAHRERMAQIKRDNSKTE